MDIVVDPKDASSATTAWRGSALLACLETAQELWIHPEEWSRQGQRLLRERAAFPWT
jgi:actin-related protein 8